MCNLERIAIPLFGKKAPLIYSEVRAAIFAPIPNRLAQQNSHTLLPQYSLRHNQVARSAVAMEVHHACVEG